MDRYTKIVLTVIAGALVYLCIVLTPLPALQAQTAARPGDATGPGQMVIVGWRVPPGEMVPVTINRPVEVTGKVTTEPSERATRVVVAGWEEFGTRERITSAVRALSATSGLPVAPVQK